MESLIVCPRCSQWMVRRVAQPRPGARTVCADVCEGCGGVWLDEYELADVSDRLGALPFRIDEIRATGKRGSGITACPRCTTVPVEVALLDVAIDVCPGCRGVWLDGGEYEALARAGAMAPPEATTGTYRAAPRAAKAVKRGTFDCPRCGSEKAVAESMITPSGLVCGPCFHEHDEATMLADASRDHGAATSRMKAGAFDRTDGAASHGEWHVSGGGVFEALGDITGSGSHGTD